MILIRIEVQLYGDYGNENSGGAVKGSVTPRWWELMNTTGGELQQQLSQSDWRLLPDRVSLIRLNAYLTPRHTDLTNLLMGPWRGVTLTRGHHRLTLLSGKSKHPTFIVAFWFILFSCLFSQQTLFCLELGFIVIPSYFFHLEHSSWDVIMEAPQTALEPWHKWASGVRAEPRGWPSPVVSQPFVTDTFFNENWFLKSLVVLLWPP